MLNAADHGFDGVSRGFDTVKLQGLKKFGADRKLAR